MKPLWVSPLAQYFSEISNTPGALLLKSVMLLCSHRNQRVSVVCVGAGDAFITRYWPELMKLVNFDFIHLTVADYGLLADLAKRKVDAARKANDQSAKKLEEGYDQLDTMIRTQHGKVMYLDLLPSSPDRRLYDFMTRVNVVFILVPDDAHVSEAKRWIGRADLVVVEKPYDRDLGKALRFVKELEDATIARLDAPFTIVVAADHYLAKVWALIQAIAAQPDFLKNKLGRLIKIEWRLCEAGQVEEWRKDSLSAGLIYDLFCHVLAVASPLVDLSTIDLAKATVQVARHADCPIKTESFAWIHCVAKDYNGVEVEIEGALGKGIGADDDKYWRLVGEHSQAIHANLDPKATGTIYHELDGMKYDLADVGKGHKEMIDAIFSGEFMETPVGGLMNHQAVSILDYLTSLRSRVDSLLEKLQNPEHMYEVGATVEDIHKRAVPI